MYFVESRTGVKNRIHVLIDRQFHEVRNQVHVFSDLFGKAGTEWLKNQVQLSKDARTLLDRLLYLLDKLNILTPHYYKRVS